MVGAAAGFAALVGLPAFRNAYVRRSLAVWIAVRIGAAFVEIPRTNALQAIFVVLVVTVAVLGDAYRRDEGLFLGNLAIPLASVAPIPLGLATLLEGLARLLP